ncbi:hypothetical protein Pelo_17889 [Pelomyxa schiedti]|nr:hypothetical protein Pelo_17889 [Pelomyxa schiedti]
MAGNRRVNKHQQQNDASSSQSQSVQSPNANAPPQQQATPTTTAGCGTPIMAPALSPRSNSPAPPQLTAPTPPTITITTPPTQPDVQQQQPQPSPSHEATPTSTPIIPNENQQQQQQPQFSGFTQALMMVPSNSIVGCLCQKPQLPPTPDTTATHNATTACTEGTVIFPQCQEQQGAGGETVKGNSVNSVNGGAQSQSSISTTNTSTTTTSRKGDKAGKWNTEPTPPTSCEKEEDDDESEPDSKLFPPSSIKPAKSRRFRGQQSEIFAAPATVEGKRKQIVQNDREIAELRKKIAQVKAARDAKVATGGVFTASGGVVTSPRKYNEDDDYEEEEEEEGASQPHSKKSRTQFGRYWSMPEHERFLKWLLDNKTYAVAGLDIDAMSDYVQTRSPVQCRTHAQKFFTAVKNNKVMDPRDE